MSKVFVGRISNRVSEQDLSDLFSKYGKVSHVHMKVSLIHPNVTAKFRICAHGYSSFGPGGN